MSPAPDPSTYMDYGVCTILLFTLFLGIFYRNDFFFLRQQEKAFFEQILLLRSTKIITPYRRLDQIRGRGQFGASVMV